MKNLIFVMGDKGGVGKSTVARAMLDIFRYRKHYRVAAIDCDKRNPQFHRFYGKDKEGKESEDSLEGVMLMDLSDERTINEFVNLLDKNIAPITMVDAPATFGENLHAIHEDVGFFDLVRDLGYTVNLIHVMSRTKDSVNILKYLLDDFEKICKITVVKNGFFGPADSFDVFDTSKTKQRLLEAGGKIVYLNALSNLSFDTIDKQSISFHEASTTPVLDLANRSRVYRWLGFFEEQLDEISEYMEINENAK